MDEQDRSTFERHPAYDAPVPGRAPDGSVTSTPGSTSGSTSIGRARGRAAALVSVLAVVVALVTVGGGYAVVRWTDEPAGGFVVVMALGLLVLSALAVLAGRVGGLTTFVVIALLLPFTAALSGLTAAGQRLEDGLEELFGSSDDSALSWGEGADENAEEKPSPAEQAVALGKSGQANDFTVTVAGIECAPKLEGAAENPEYFGDEDQPEFVDAEAPAGKQLCVVSSTWENTSTKPGTVDGWSSFSSLAVADGTTYAALTDDSLLSRTLTAQAGYDGSVLNPGDEAEVRTVFTVARGQEFTHAVVEQFDLENPEVWFALR